MLCLLATAISASEPSGPASVEGSVTTDAMAALAGVTIGADALANGLHYQTSSTESGSYIINDLRPGAYSLWADAKGYGCVIYPRVALFAGQHFKQDFHFEHAKKTPGACEPIAKKKGD